jgi:hypothetical protein
MKDACCLVPYADNCLGLDYVEKSACRLILSILVHAEHMLT